MASKFIKIKCKFDNSKCRKCGCLIGVGADVLWDVNREVKGVECFNLKECDGRIKAAKAEYSVVDADEAHWKDNAPEMSVAGATPWGGAAVADEDRFGF